ncbi:peptidylprolyl isomerase [Trinickia caryophylli]|uniref:Peptidylprolyl isomerase n=1 Tax=Trinickia caryophylli TaxID=28094 RepID=A0A1X7H5B5_TRICW|nr:peptidylprolyl isomerase [Trinickia caryophylli]PMS09616.1 peptidylprolyl isomerase [Trinickia caryophylli]TRX17247.1 peptidylprolyl isomerase [Trinickia caryophylli]WQE12018.1 peptidylprolyl isomerase [Trinickia caryophylli]SMF79782.1 peptidylprolyl isomerase [Trinickia caryophylli]GLU35589.1 peptidylprolyl isomerase [Trinickia caryophylli]
MKRFAWLVCMAASCAPAAAWAQDDVVARAGGVAVKQSDITSLLHALDAPTRARIAGDPKSADAIVRARVAQAAVLAEAKSKGWDRREEVAQMIESAKREVIVRSYLASVSEPPADYPSDAQLQAAYDANTTAWTVPAAAHLAQIFVAVPAGADKSAADKAQKRADSLAKSARAAGADFAALAKANSDESASAARGGDMGFLPDTLLVPEIRKVVQAMKPGDISQPVRTASGFHIVKLIESRVPSVRPLADVKEMLRASLRRSRTQQNAEAYLAKAGGDSALSIDEAALKKAVDAAQ